MAEPEQVNIATAVGRWGRDFGVPMRRRDPLVIDMYADFIESRGLGREFNEYAKQYQPNHNSEPDDFG